MSGNNGKSQGPLSSGRLPPVTAEELAVERREFQARAEASGRKLERIEREVRKFMDRLRTQWPAAADLKIVARTLEGYAVMLADEARALEINEKVRAAGPRR